MPNSIQIKNSAIEYRLTQLSSHAKEIFNQHPLINKIVVLAIFIFRSAMMSAYMAALPFTSVPSFFIGLGISVFYRVTIEPDCRYRFAILSCVGAETYSISKPALLALINGMAFRSLITLSMTLLSAAPFAICATVILSEVNQNVDDRCALTPSCHQSLSAKEKLKSLVNYSKKSCCDSNA